MEKIYSKVDPTKLLHIIWRSGDHERQDQRTDLVPPDNFIQCSALKLPNGKTFRPHKHITRDRHYPEQLAQESWVVVRGRVRCKLYDIDDRLIAEPVIEAGDASFTLYGGHTYEVLEDNTIVYEYKSGPYEGQEWDKEFI